MRLSQSIYCYSQRYNLLQYILIDIQCYDHLGNIYTLKDSGSVRSPTSVISICPTLKIKYSIKLKHLSLSLSLYLSIYIYIYIYMGRMRSPPGSIRRYQPAMICRLWINVHAVKYVKIHKALKYPKVGLSDWRRSSKRNIQVINLVKRRRSKAWRQTTDPWISKQAFLNLQVLHPEGGLNGPQLTTEGNGCSLIVTLLRYCKWLQKENWTCDWNLWQRYLLVWLQKGLALWNLNTIKRLTIWTSSHWRPAISQFWSKCLVSLKSIHYTINNTFLPLYDASNFRIQFAFFLIC